MLFDVEDYMLPCLFKEFFGVECLGCGFQTSLIALLKGNFTEAFYTYPAIYTLILLGLFAILQYKFKFKKGKRALLILASINLIIIVTSYFLKINEPL